MYSKKSQKKIIHTKNTLRNNPQRISQEKIAKRYITI